MENHTDVPPVHLLLATAAGPARVYGDVLREEEGELEKCQVTSIMVSVAGERSEVDLWWIFSLHGSSCMFKMIY